MGKADISISIDGDLHNGTGEFPTFVPGQVVSGKVHLALHLQKKIDSVVISFEGTCFTEIVRHSNNQRHRYNETIQLFDFTTTLFQGPYTMQRTNLEWPFSFTFPEITDYTRERGGDNPLYTAVPQPLPPSLDVHYSYKDLKAKVFYSLTATLNPHSFIGAKRSTLPLVLVPYSTLTLPVPGSIPLRAGWQSWRSSSLRPEKHSFKQKMSHVFTSDPALKTPSVNFEATAYLPQAASIWQPLSAAFSIRYRQQAPTDPKKVTLILDAVTLELKQFTNVTIKGVFGSHDAHGSEILATYRFRPGVTLALDGSTASITEAFKLVDMTKEIYRLAPTFNTYTIAHSYKLKISAIVLHPETGHRFEIKTKTPFTILPIENPIPTSLTHEQADIAPVYVDESALPAYEDAPSSSTHQHGLPNSHYPEKAGLKYAHETSL